jgi:hypothetical protein
MIREVIRRPAGPDFFYNLKRTGSVDILRCHVPWSFQGRFSAEESAYCQALLTADSLRLRSGQALTAEAGPE